MHIKFRVLATILAMLIGTFCLSFGVFSLTDISLTNTVKIGNTGQISIHNATAASGYWRDIQNAINYVSAHGGGNVFIPAGTWNFVNVRESWTGGRVTISPGVNIFGAPTIRDANDQVITWKTILVMPWEVPQNCTWFDYVLNYETPQDGFRFSDLSLVGYRYFNSSASVIETYIGLNMFEATYTQYATAGIMNFRVDHCNFQDMCGNAVSCFPYAVKNNRRVMCGVIDHNRMVNTYGDPALYPKNPDYQATVDYGVTCQRWASDVWDDNIENVWGQYTNYTIVVENNYFSKWRHCVLSNDGMHVIIRYNVFDGDYGTGTIDSHGSYADNTHTYAVGTRCQEIYNNTFQSPDTTWTTGTWCINHRGGSDMIFNNTVTGYRYFIDLNAADDNDYQPKCSCNQTYIWNNTIGNVTFFRETSWTQDVNWFLRAPSLAQDGLTYTPYTYPAL
jgi:hypothetical protein